MVAVGSATDIGAMPGTVEMNATIHGQLIAEASGTARVRRRRRVWRWVWGVVVFVVAIGLFAWVNR